MTNVNAEIGKIRARLAKGKAKGGVFKRKKVRSDKGRKHRRHKSVAKGKKKTQGTKVVPVGNSLGKRAGAK